MAGKQAYTGGCHCGAVTFEANADLGEVVSCNCSICQKVGSLWSFVPASDFKLLSGDAALTDYQFGKKTLHHQFCRVCGIHSFSSGAMPDGTKMVALNTRCLDGIEPPELTTNMFNGRAL